MERVYNNIEPSFLFQAEEGPGRWFTPSVQVPQGETDLGVDLIFDLWGSWSRFIGGSAHAACFSCQVYAPSMTSKHASPVQRCGHLFVMESCNEGSATL